MDFFYNCKASNDTKVSTNNQELISDIKKKKEIETNPTIKKVKFEIFSHFELALLFINVMILM